MECGVISAVSKYKNETIHRKGYVNLIYKFSSNNFWFLSNHHKVPNYLKYGINIYTVIVTWVVLSCTLHTTETINHKSKTIYYLELEINMIYNMSF